MKTVAPKRETRAPYQAPKLTRIDGARRVFDSEEPRGCQGWDCHELSTWARWRGRYAGDWPGDDTFDAVWYAKSTARYCYDHAIRAGWVPGPLQARQLELVR